MIRSTRPALLASALGITLLAAACGPDAARPIAQQNPNTLPSAAQGPTVVGSGNNASVAYPAGQGPAVVGGGVPTTTTGSGQNMSSERADQGRGNSPTVSGSNTTPRSGGTGQSPSAPQVTGSGNNMSTERPGVKLWCHSSVPPKADTASTAIQPRQPVRRHTCGVRRTSVASNPNTPKWASLSIPMKETGDCGLPPEANTTAQANASAQNHARFAAPELLVNSAIGTEQAARVPHRQRILRQFPTGRTSETRSPLASMNLRSAGKLTTTRSAGRPPPEALIKVRPPLPALEVAFTNACLRIPEIFLGQQKLELPEYLAAECRSPTVLLQPAGQAIRDSNVPPPCTHTAQDIDGYRHSFQMVGPVRFELTTPCTPCKCATSLRYGPNLGKGAKATDREGRCKTFLRDFSGFLRTADCRFGLRNGSPSRL